MHVRVNRSILDVIGAVTMPEVAGAAARRVPYMLHN